MILYEEYLKKVESLVIDSNTSLIALLNLYIISSVLYYQYDINLIQDHQFDFICKRLLEGFDFIMNNDRIRKEHKECLDKESLIAGTGFTIKHNSLDITTYNLIQNIVRMKKQ